MKKILLLLSAAFLLQPAMAAETWTVKSPMPVAVTGAAAACIDSYVYVAGGVVAGSGVNTLYAYNVYTDTWSTRAPMATIRNDHFLVASGGKLYAIGGYSSSGALNSVEEYNPATNTWTTKAPMPTARSLFSGAAVNGKIYVTGGWPSTFAVHEEYDIATNTWTTKAPLALGKLQLGGGAAMGGKFYFLGGKNYANTAFYDTCAIYNPATNTWSYGPTMPVARFASGTTYQHGRIYHMGGGQGYFAVPNFNNNVYLDSATNTWQTALACPAKRSYAMAVAAPNNKIYLIGGADSAGTAVDWTHEYSSGIVPTTAVNEAVLPSVAVQLFPNPAHNGFMVSLPQDAGSVTAVSIVSLTGQQYTAAYSANASEVSVQTAGLAAGIYTVIVSDEKRRYVANLQLR